MSQHVDVIYMKKDGNLHRFFDFCKKCDLNLAQTLLITDHVCKQVKANFPNIKSVFSKSDNAGHYSGNGYLEGACHILKENGFSRIKHDFNEPQKG